MSFEFRSRRRVTIRMRPKALTRRLIFEPLEERLPLTTFIVNSLDDPPVNLGNATVTLRDAIHAANNNVPARRDGPPGTEFDVIQFQAGLSGTITLTDGPLGLRSNITIVGPGAGVITISGGAAGDRVFDVNDFTATAVIVTIRGLKISSGEELLPASNQGGGIFNRENLTIEDSIISGNKALNGGGVFNDALGTLTVRNSQITGNSAGSGTATQDGQGGGLFNAGQATLIDSRVNANSVGFGSAGGIFNTGTLTLQSSLVDGNGATLNVGGIRNSGVLNILNSTIANNRAFNSADFDGQLGGLHNEPSGTVNVQNSTISGNTAALFAGVMNQGSMTLENSTVSGNLANRDIGGIYNSFTGMLTLRNSTIAANRADVAGGGFGSGAGLHNANLFGVVMHNTIIADNVRGSGAGSVIVDNFSGEPASPVSSRNLVGTGDSSGLANGGVQGNLIGVTDAMLGALAGNGGTMQTHAPLPGSPAINAGSNAEIPQDAFDLDGDANTMEPIPFDQRGNGFARIAGTAVDIGAIEEQSAGPALPGDYNLDGRVNAADYVLWRNTEGDTVAPFSGADGSGNGLIDAGDYQVWRENFGNTLTPGIGSSAELAIALAPSEQLEPSEVEANSSRTSSFILEPLGAAQFDVRAGTEPADSAPSHFGLDDDSLLLLALQMSVRDGSRASGALPNSASSQSEVSADLVAQRTADSLDIVWGDWP